MSENYILSVAGAFIAGIWFSGLYVLPAAMLYSLSAVALFLTVLALRNSAARALPCLLVVFFLAGAVRFIHADAISPADISHFAGKTVAVAATVDDAPEVTMLEENKRKVRYVFTVNQVQEYQGQIRPALGKVTSSVRQDMHLPVARQGDSVTFTAKIAKPHNHNNPGAYDFEAALKRQGITARATITGETFAITGGQGGWTDTVSAWRMTIRDRMNAVMSREQTAILFGMLFGGYTDIPPAVVKDFAATGLVHILSVSGTHIALVTGVAVWLGRVIGLKPVLTMAAAGFIVLFYGAVSGFTPPVIRSSVMGVISLAAVALGRDRDARAALALAALAMLIDTPGLIYDLSFQLSFAATAGLVWLYPPLAGQLQKRLPHLLAAGLAITLAAQLSVLPVLAWYFNSLSLSSFVANIVLLPIIEAVVIFGLLGTLAALIWSAGGSVILAVCGVAIAAIVDSISLLAKVPGSSVYLPSFGYAFSAAYYLILLWSFGYKPAFVPDAGWLARRSPKLTSFLVVCLAGCFAVYAYWPRPAAVHFIDVGQGDAVLVTTPHGRSVLIDAGGTAGESGFDVGDRVVAPYLRHYGVLSLDYLILTHGHQDHAGGAAAVVAAVPVKNVLLATEAHSAAITKLLAVRSGSSFIPAYKGQAVMLDGVGIEVVHAPVRQDVKRGGNEASAVVRVSFGAHSFLITGDLTAAEEKSMAGNGLSQSTVLKVAHHGARSSTSPEFLQAVKPGFAVISAGYNNRYGHPHAETLQRLDAHSVTYFRTDVQGAVVFKTDGYKLTVNTYLP